ncbi:hypothetical protein WA1_40125 [Scytonema hofmannii PCC 7110]|uniref:Uncharacterized protein n=1 Tax=Scytonema hofmannii PCC 7110 TaxID=128403 RepID=A0A139WYZ8_9CYAN|nr:hypothetical protein [Scytonema hofmannii]KYC37671.1 hypothetical protein WA1_40125 [Scytonema hofmannii PCC 7110]
MESNKKSDHQMEINDLIDLAITNAMIRRGLSDEGCLVLSDDEAGKIVGGLKVSRDTEALDRKNPEVIVAGFKPICPPVIVVGLIAQDYDQLA